MKYKYGFIGSGNMGGAMIHGVINAGIADKSEVIASCKTLESKARKAEFGITMTLDNTEVVKNSDIIILAVKPYQFDEVLPIVKENLNDDQIVVSVAAGKSISDIEDALISMDDDAFDNTMASLGAMGSDAKLPLTRLKIARAMPNTPAAVGEAMSGVCFNENFTSDDKEKIMAIFNSFGKAVEVKESMMDTVIGISGSSPAFIYMLIEAMADEAVVYGMPRKDAYIFAAQSVYGTAKMVLETGKHPGELKDAVCSPGGTTIAGVEALENAGFRSDIMKGIKAAIEKSRNM